VSESESVEAALLRAQQAVAARPGHALDEVLAAIKATAGGGDREQFQQADRLLDAETFASGLFAPTIKPLLEARVAAQRREQLWIVACLSRRLAWVYDFAGDDVAAIEMIDEARTAFVALGDDEGLTRTLNNMGVIWTRRRDLVGAERALKAALELADQTGIVMEQARVRMNYGHLCELLGNFERGEELLQQGYALALSINHPATTVALVNLARLQLARGDTAEATRTLDHASGLIEASNHLGRVEGCLVRGQIASREGRHADAVRYLNDGIALAAGSGAMREEMELWEALGAAQAAAGDFAAAFAATRRSQALDDKLRRERAVLQAATSVERRAAERAQRDAETARASELALRETLTQLEHAQRELERANGEKDTLLAELHRQTREDSLTGLLNRRALDAELDRECTRAERYQRPLALVLLDIDNFKIINDTCSHAVGDAVLTTVARCLRGARRQSDVVARLGGEELVMLLPETSSAHALAVCESLRVAMGTVNWPALGAPPRVTASMGVAVFVAGDTPAALLRRADAAMYAAKRAGKDRVVLADADPADRSR